MRAYGPIWLALLLGLAPPAGASPPDPILALGRARTQQLYAGELEALFAEMGESLQRSIGGLDGLRGFWAGAAARLGGETRLVEENVTLLGAVETYSRIAEFEKQEGRMELLFSFGRSGAVELFLVRPAAREAPTDHLGYRTRTPLRLPFQGEWHVAWGGRSVGRNHHATTVDQRFALDLVVLQERRTFRAGGQRNEDYACWDRPVLAPAPGRVAGVVDDVPDNRPGVMNPGDPPGNHVVIDHGNGEFSFLAHLKRGSVRVARGDEVEAGTPLGRCGNSGNSSEPHLHYHLQDSADFGAGAGLPALFRDYVADGVAVEEGEPVKRRRARAAP